MNAEDEKHLWSAFYRAVVCNDFAGLSNDQFDFVLQRLPVPNSLREQFGIPNDISALHQWAILGVKTAHRVKKKAGRKRGTAGSAVDHRIIEMVTTLAEQRSENVDEVLRFSMKYWEENGALVMESPTEKDTNVDRTTHLKRLRRVRKQRESRLDEGKPPRGPNGMGQK